MIPGAVHRSPGICLTAEENPGKPQLGDSLMKGLCHQSSPEMGFIPSISFLSFLHFGRKKHVREEGKRRGFEKKRKSHPVCYHPPVGCRSLVDRHGFQ